MEEDSRPQDTVEYDVRRLPVVVREFGAIIIKTAIWPEKMPVVSPLPEFSEVSADYTEPEDAFLADAPLAEEVVQETADGAIEESDETEESDKGLHREEEEFKTSSLFLQIQGMSVAKKIEFAMKCNKEARTILIRDSNRLVQMSVIRSPKITESEVVSIVNNRSVHEDVLKHISMQRDWMKNYEVRVGLVFNPKTPLFISTKQVITLKERDLSKLGRSKAVPRVLSITAVRRLHEVKR